MSITLYPNSIKVEDGTTHEQIPLTAIKGDKGDRGLQGVRGEKGDTYTITEADYEAIAEITEAEYETELNTLKEDLANLETNLADNKKLVGTKTYIPDLVSGGISGTSGAKQTNKTRLRTNADITVSENMKFLAEGLDSSGRINNILYGIQIFRYPTDLSSFSLIYGWKNIAKLLDDNIVFEPNYVYRFIIRDSESTTRELTATDIANLTNVFFEQSLDYGYAPLMNTDKTMTKENVPADAKAVGQLIGKNTIVVDVNGDGDYTKITDGIANAILIKDTTVIVKKGVYDLVAEYGQSALDSTTKTTTNIHGMILGNGVKVICESGVKILFNYVGTNTFIHTAFAPINSGEGGFTLENAYIDAKNCRYCVHDERGEDIKPYTNKYLNCCMYIDNTSNADWSNEQCIGGGLGGNGYIVVEGGMFNGSVTWHTTTSTSITDATNTVIIKDNYFLNGVDSEKPAGITLSSASTIRTSGLQRFIVTNNSMQRAINKVDSGGVMTYKEFNNIVR